MKVLIAIDSFKGSISSSDACLAAARGFTRAGITDITSLPSSDGGEGFCVCMRSLFGGEVLHDTVAAPCGGQTDAEYVFDFASETAYVELACASGLTLVPEGKRDIMSASTLGTGELIKAAAAAGAKRIVIGLGGSATNDCGMGLLHALGVRFYGADGNVLVPCARSMPLVVRADKTALRGYEGISFTAACDVTNPLCGENGAARVFARQKGASEREISLLDEYAASFARAVGIDPLSAGAGAAGGTGGALISVLGAEFVSGASLLTGAERFREALSGASLVLTGEGKLPPASLSVRWRMRQRAPECPALPFPAGFPPGASCFTATVSRRCFRCAAAPQALNTAWKTLGCLWNPRHTMLQGSFPLRRGKNNKKSSVSAKASAETLLYLAALYIRVGYKRRQHPVHDITFASVGGDVCTGHKRAYA